MLETAIFGISGLLILAFSQKITKKLYITFNLWAEEANNNKIRNRLKTNSMKKVLVVTILFGLFWLAISVSLFLGSSTDSVYSVTLLIAGVISLIFNRKIGAINSFWIVKYRSLSTHVFWGRLNVILGGLFLIFISFLFRH